jgi:hypothetical protein
MAALLAMAVLQELQLALVQVRRGLPHVCQAGNGLRRPAPTPWAPAFEPAASHRLRPTWRLLL